MEENDFFKNKWSFSERSQKRFKKTQLEQSKTDFHNSKITNEVVLRKTTFPTLKKNREVKYSTNYDNWSKEYYIKALNQINYLSNDELSKFLSSCSTLSKNGLNSI